MCAERAHNIVSRQYGVAAGWSAGRTPRPKRPHTVCSVHSSRATWLVALATVQRPRAHPAPHTRGRERAREKNAVLRRPERSAQRAAWAFRLRRGTCYVHVLIEAGSGENAGLTLDPRPGPERWRVGVGCGCGGTSAQVSARAASTRRSAADGSSAAAARTAACGEARESLDVARHPSRPTLAPDRARQAHAKRRIDPARISALPTICAVPSPSRARPPKVPAPLSYTFRLFSLFNIH